MNVGVVYVAYYPVLAQHHHRRLFEHGIDVCDGDGPYDGTGLFADLPDVVNGVTTGFEGTDLGERFCG